MHKLPIILLIIISIVHFILAYICLSDKAGRFEGIIMWNWSRNGRYKEVRDKEGYIEQQGKSNIIFGIIFLITSILVYLIDITNLSYKILYLWFIVIVFMQIKDHLKKREYFK